MSRTKDKNGTKALERSKEKLEPHRKEDGYKLVMRCYFLKNWQKLLLYNSCFTNKIKSNKIAFCSSNLPNFHMHHIPTALEIQKQISQVHNIQQFNLLQWILVILAVMFFYIPNITAILIRIYIFIIQAYYTVLNYSLPIISISLLIILAYCLFRIWYFKKQLKNKYLFLEITPPERSTQSPLATREFFTQLYNFTLPYKRWWRFFIPTQKIIYSLELVATKKQGIRYLIRIPEKDIDMVKKTLYSYLPNIRIKQTTDPLPIHNNKINANGWWQIYEMILGNHYVYPLAVQTQLPQHDPIAYITGNMTKLSDEEMVMMQILVTPLTELTHKRVSKQINKVFDSVWNQEHFFKIVHKNKLKESIFFLLFLPVRLAKMYILFDIDLLLSPIWVSIYIFTLGKSRLFPFTFPVKQPERVELTTEQKDLHQEVLQKVTQEMFETTCRFFIIQKTNQDLTSRNIGLTSSFRTFTNDPYQGFMTKRKLFFTKWNSVIDIFRLKYRLHPFRNNPILSVTDLANIYHLPYTDTTKTEDLVKSKTTYLPLPLRLKNEEHFDTIFAVNRHDGLEYKIGLTKDERRRHVYVLGGTGTGKTTLLSSMIMSDRNANELKGMCIIDAHGELIQFLLERMEEDGRWGTIVFDPSDIDHPIGINLLEIPDGLSENELAKQKDLIASSLISIFTKLYPPKAMGYRMEHVLRVATLTALETKDPTLFTIQRILTDTKYRNSIVPTLKDPVLSLYWNKEFKQLGSFQRSQLVSPITNKIGQFITSPFTRYIVGQKKSTINFDEIINDSATLLCNLSKGKIGEDISTFLGGLITAKIQLAALKRVSIPEKERRDFYLYIDEFQNFATESFAQIMSEARKYRLNAILAHQNTAQIQDKDLLKVILGNVGSVITLRTSPDEEAFILPHFQPFIEKGEIINLPSFEFYMKISAIHPTDPFSGEVTPYEDCTCSDEDAEKEIREETAQDTINKSQRDITVKCATFREIKTSGINKPIWSILFTKNKTFKLL